jgi:glycosyltransferase involved in cell wall biosynthesis
VKPFRFVAPYAYIGKERQKFKPALNIGFVVTELLDGRFVPWESSLQWESYLDLYCLALARKGHRCVKYVPSTGVSKTRSYVHKFGHVVKRIPVYSRIFAPKRLLKPRAYEGGYTTIARQLLAPPFTLNLLWEAMKDDLDLLHYSSYYSSFFIPAFAVAKRFPVVVQYTGGAMPSTSLGRLTWGFMIIPSLKASRAVLLGDYSSEARSLSHHLSVPKVKQAFFNAPIIDEKVFREMDKNEAQKRLGFNPAMKNILCVSYIPRKHKVYLAKDPYLMVDTVGRAVNMGGNDITLHVAGWGAGEEEFRNYVKDSGLSARVRVLGMVEHQKLPLYYSASDLIFIPVRWEKLNEGSATVEAFACKRPVVAFKRHETDKTEQAGGFLIEDDPERGPRTLLSYLRRDEYLEDKGAEGMLLSKDFTMDQSAKRLEEIYNNVLR